MPTVPPSAENTTGTQHHQFSFAPHEITRKTRWKLRDLRSLDFAAQAQQPIERDHSLCTVTVLHIAISYAYRYNGCWEDFLLRCEVLVLVA
jgi:hypothetical protein